MDVNRDGAMDFERGAAILKGKFYYLWHRRRGGERVGVWDLEKDSRQSYQPPFFISYFLPPSNSLLPVGIQNNHFYRHYRRIIDLKSGQTLLGQKVGADYAFALTGEKWLYLGWQKNRWIIGEYHQKKRENRILYQLPAWVSLKRPRLFQKEGHFWLSFQVFDLNGLKPYQLWAWRLGDNRPLVLRQRSDVFTYWDQCNGIHLLKNPGKGVELLELNVLDQVVSKKINVAWAEQISFMIWDVDHTVMFLRDDPEKAWHLAKGCEDIVAELSREVNSKSIKKVSSVSQKPTTQIQHNVKDYSAWQYMRPSWWWLGANYKNERFYAVLQTSLEDPKRFHGVDLGIETSSQKGEFDFTGSYRYRFFDFREAYARIEYQHSQRPREWNRRSRDVALSYYENFYFSRFIWKPILSLSEQREENFVYKTTLAQQLSYHAPRTDAFFYRGILDLRLSRSWRRNYLAYTGGGAGLKIYLQPFDRLLVGLNAQYDKLFKKSIRGEILYGGGIDARHSFYGLDYQDAWGNELLTAGGHLDGELARIYSSWGLTPFYLKEIRLLAGIDYIKADVIWLARDKTYTTEELTSNYWGVRLKLDIFYKNPTTWDFLQVNLDNPLGGRDARFISSFNVSF